MNNYEYIIAGLPQISPDGKSAKDIDADGLIGFIRSQCDDYDKRLIDIVGEGFTGAENKEGFYKGVVRHRNRFIREFFSFDLALKNAKARHTNKILGQEEDAYLVLPELEDDFEEKEWLEGILAMDDILLKESELDKLVWEKIDGITRFDYFDIEAILAFVAKLHIVDRWLKLDEEKGKQLLKDALEQIRGTFSVEMINLPQE